MSRSYIRRRRERLLDMLGDQLAGFEAFVRDQKAKGAELPAETEAVLAKIDAVKTAIPKTAGRNGGKA